MIKWWQVAMWPGFASWLSRVFRSQLRAGRRVFRKGRRGAVRLTSKAGRKGIQAGRKRIRRGGRLGLRALRRSVRSYRKRVRHIRRSIVRGGRHKVRTQPRHIWDAMRSYGPEYRPGSRSNLAASQAALARAALIQGDFREARATYEELLSSDPTNSSAWAGLAKAARGARDFTAAKHAAWKAVQLDPTWPDAMWILADLLASDKRTHEVQKVLRPLGPIGEQDENSAKRTLSIVARLGDAELLLNSAREVLDSYPDHAEALYQELHALLRLGRKDEAEGRAQEHYQRGQGSVIQALSRYLADRGRWDEVVAIVDAEENRADPDLLMQIGRSFSRGGRLEDARTTFERLLELVPDHGLAGHWYRLVDGELRALRGEWRYSAATGPGIVSPTASDVLHIVGRSLPHAQVGYTIRTHEIARAQRVAGLDSRVVTQLGFPVSAGAEDPPSMEMVDGVPYHRLLVARGIPAALDMRLQEAFELLCPLVEQIRPAILHAASDYLNAEVALAIGERYSLPVVYEVRGFWEESWASKQPDGALESVRYSGRREAEVRVARQADCVSTLGEAMRDHLCSWGVDREKIHVVPNAVDPTRFSLQSRDATLADTLGTNGKIVIGCVSSLIGYEGIDCLIEATMVLRQRGWDVLTLVVGDGPAAATLRHHVDQVDVDGAVQMLGRIPHSEVLRYYSLMDVVVLPRRGDRVCQLVTPLKPFEAMATQKPLVVSNVAALKEVVRENLTGRTFVREDAESLADNIEALLKNPGLCETLGNEARRWVVNEHTWDHNVVRQLQMYEGLTTLPFRRSDGSSG